MLESAKKNKGKKIKRFFGHRPTTKYDMVSNNGIKTIINHSVEVINLRQMQKQ